MKKVICIVLVLVMALAATVVAESVPSPAINDLTAISVIPETLTDENAAASETATGEISLIVDEDTSDEAEALVENEIEKMAEDVSAYFNADEAIAAIIGEGEYTVDEMIVLYVSGYEETYGDVDIAVAFVTPYEPGEKVAVMFGIVNGADIEWTVIEGTANEAGAVVMTLTPDQLLAAQEGTALISVISK